MKRMSNIVRRSSMFVVAARKSSARADSIVSFNGRGSISELPARKINYENTYRMGPDKKPCISELEPIIRDTISTTCDQIDYDEIYPAELVSTLNTEVHRRLKSKLPTRYKLVVQTFFINDQDQDYTIGSRWLWDPTSDDHITVTFHAKNLTVVSIVHLIYQE